MKKLSILIGILSLFVLISCGVAETEAETEETFQEISRMQLNVGKIYEYRHNETGCHYMVTTGDGKAVIQMLDVSGKPYCD